VIIVTLTLNRKKIQVCFGGISEQIQRIGIHVASVVMIVRGICNDYIRTQSQTIQKEKVEK
jgi:hypothetical protein